MGPVVDQGGDKWDFVSTVRCWWGSRVCVCVSMVCRNKGIRIYLTFSGP